MSPVGPWETAFEAPAVVRLFGSVRVRLERQCVGDGVTRGPKHFEGIAVAWERQAADSTL
jgi:hypothetical protein